jgi:hypothetical protein
MREKFSWKAEALLLCNLSTMLPILNFNNIARSIFPNLFYFKKFLVKYMETEKSETRLDLEPSGKVTMIAAIQVVFIFTSVVPVR